MRHRSLVFIAVVAAGLMGGGVMVGFRAQTPSAGSSKDAAVERTPRGDPDLQGIWSPGYYLTPLANEQANKILEAACHEGNYAMTSILAVARLQEEERKGAAPAQKVAPAAKPVPSQ